MTWAPGPQGQLFDADALMAPVEALRAGWGTDPRASMKSPSREIATASTPEPATAGDELEEGRGIRATQDDNRDAWHITCDECSARMGYRWARYVGDWSEAVNRAAAAEHQQWHDENDDAPAFEYVSAEHAPEIKEGEHPNAEGWRIVTLADKRERGGWCACDGCLYWLARPAPTAAAHQYDTTLNGHTRAFEHVPTGRVVMIRHRRIHQDATGEQLPDPDSKTGPLL